jgi:hypothetical protein
MEAASREAHPVSASFRNADVLDPALTRLQPSAGLFVICVFQLLFSAGR